MAKNLGRCGQIFNFLKLVLLLTTPLEGRWPLQLLHFCLPLHQFLKLVFAFLVGELECGLFELKLEELGVVRIVKPEGALGV